MSLFDKREIIRKRREEKRQTLEELAWGICDYTTLGRYERGKVDPSEEKLSQIFKKLDLKYQGNIVAHEISIFSDDDSYEKIEKLLHDKKFEELNVRLEKYMHGMNTNNYIEKKQFLGRIKLLLNMDRGETYVYELENLLMLSIGDYSSGRISLTNIYNETELYLLNDIAIAYWDIGRNDLALRMYKDLTKYFDNCVSYQDSVIFNKIFLNYSNYLGLSKKYEESINVCEKAIRWMQNNKTQDLMFVFIFNIGWNYFYKKNECGDIKLMEKAKDYVGYAIALGEYYHESQETLMIMKDFYRNNFL